MLLNLIWWVSGLLWFIAGIAIAFTITSSPTMQGDTTVLWEGAQVIENLCGKMQGPHLPGMQHGGGRGLRGSSVAAEVASSILQHIRCQLRD